MKQKTNKMRLREYLALCHVMLVAEGLGKYTHKFCFGRFENYNMDALRGR